MDGTSRLPLLFTCAGVLGGLSGDYDCRPVGNLKENYWREAANEYLKRLAAYAQVAITEAPESRVGSPPFLPRPAYLSPPAGVHRSARADLPRVSHSAG